MRTPFVSALAALAVVGAALGLLADEGKKTEREERGIVKTVDVEKGSLVVRGVRDGDTGDKTFNLTKGVKVLVGDRDTKLADLKPGMLINLKLDPASGDVVGIAIVAVGRPGEDRKPREGDRPPGERDGERRGPIVRGLIRSVDDAKQTLTATVVTEDALEDHTLGIAKELKVLVDGQERKLAELPAKATVFMQLSADRKTVVAIRAEGPLQRAKIQAVDAGKGTITLTAGDGGQPGRTLDVAKDAQISINGKPATLADIKPEAGVVLKLSLDRSKVVGVMIVPRDGDRPREGDKPREEKK